MANPALSSSKGPSAPVSRISLALFLILILAVAGGTVFLLTWDIPAPLQDLEQVVPNARFPA